MRIKSLVGSLSILSILVMPPARSANSDVAAVAAAQNWLSKVDHGAYAIAWTDAAAYFKGAVTQDAFSQQLQGVRAPLGKVISRKLFAKKDMTSMPGAPDGKYVVIQFSTNFAQKKSAVETITPMLDKDGKWRVSGYFIK